ncbi:MAG: hypothetical protein GY862_16920, partial [Gammaproteobacteria bacterium]|nr:hypothetical protein [Gammaproteobacteria bacterium]
MEPYKGLRPYEESDRDNFFGREAEKRILADKILTNKLTLLFAASGVGKSSLLQAAVLPELKRPDCENLDVIYCRDWVQNPFHSLRKEICEELIRADKIDKEQGLDLDAPLKEFLRQCTFFSSEPLVLVLDQFEEFFNYQSYGPHFKPFIKELAAAILDRGAATVFVFSMREDFALELNAFKPALPTLLFDNFYRLEKLNRDRAKQAIAEPVEHLGYAYEEGLLDLLLEDLSRREQIERFGASAAATLDIPPAVEPPHLQIVCMQLWDADKNNPDKRITRATYEAKGRADGLLNNYFKEQINAFSAEEKRLASAAFDHLVSKQGTKMARPLDELAHTLNVNRTHLGRTLDRLEQARILRRQIRHHTHFIPLEKDTIHRFHRLHRLFSLFFKKSVKSVKSVDERSVDSVVPWYELYHDIFTRSITEWNDAYKFRQRLRRAGQIAVGVVLTGSLALVAYDGWSNAVRYHFRLSTKAGGSDAIELWQGETDPLFDLFGQRRFLKETAYGRRDLEPDKLFYQRQVLMPAAFNPELIERLPLTARLQGQLDNADLNTALCLANAGISPYDKLRGKDLIQTLGAAPSFIAYRHLIDLYGGESDHELKQSMGETLLAAAAPPPLLHELLDAPHPFLRASAVEQLTDFGSDDPLAVALRAFKDTDWQVRRSAMEALGRLGAAAAIEPLTRALKDTRSGVRSNAAEALGRLGAAAAIEPLTRALKDTDYDVRRSAAQALGRLGAAAA